MDEIEGTYIYYTPYHEEIVIKGIEAINDYLIHASDKEKRSLLFCLDKYLDPYYGYPLPFFDEAIAVLEEHLFMEHNKEVKEDILQLLSNYSKDRLDYLAEHLDRMDNELLADAIYSLGLTFNQTYIPILKSFENHKNMGVQRAVKEAIETIGGG